MKLVKECIWTVATLALAVAMARVASVPGAPPSFGAPVSTLRLADDIGGKPHASVLRSTFGTMACDDGSDSGNDGDGDDGGSDDAGGY